MAIREEGLDGMDSAARQGKSNRVPQRAQGKQDVKQGLL